MDTTYVLIWAAFAIIGALIGSAKNRVAAGAVLGFLIGPIGWALIHFGPDYSKKSAPEAASGNQTATSQLLDLKTLLDKGVITQQEFEEKKQKLLGKI